MAILTQTYQYIGRSGPVSCKAGWNYYILLYAKTAGDMLTGTHTVSVQMELACTSDATFYGYGTTGAVTVNRVHAIYWDGAAIPGADWSASGGLTEGGVYYYRHTTLATGTAQVNTGWGAASDVPIAVNWGRTESVDPVPGWLPYYKTYATGTITVTLPAILGASTITGADPAVLGSSCCVRWNTLSAALSYRLGFALGSWTELTDPVRPGIAGSYTYTGFTIPMEAARQLPDAASGTASVTLYTYSESGEQIGAGSTAYFTVSVPDSAAPTVSFLEIEPVNVLPAPFDGLFIKGKSRVQARATAAGQYGASIASCTLTLEGSSFLNGGISGYLSTSGNVAVRAQVRDSRGLTGSCTEIIRVLDYTSPAVSVSRCARAESDGTLSDSGECLALAFSGTCAPLGGQNSCSLWYRWKLANAPDSGFSDPVTLTGGSAYAGVITDVQFGKQASYVVQLGVTDGLGEMAIAACTVLTERIYWHRGGDFLALGMYTQSGGLECGWPARFYGEVYIGTTPLKDYIENLIQGG